MKILLVEDESDLADIVSYHLEQEGFEVTHAETGGQALTCFHQQFFDLILLDLMLPDMSGVDICQKIRTSINNATVPIMMVTAKGEELDRVKGFEVGADDYVVKPFSSRELILRIKAILRRNATDNKSADSKHRILEYVIFKMDLESHRVWIDNEEVILTSLEFKLLYTFLSKKGLVLTRSALLEDVWEMDPNMNTRTVDKHVQRLRQKIGTASQYIDTIRGVGYRLTIE